MLKSSKPARVPTTIAVNDLRKDSFSQVLKPIEAEILPPIEIQKPHPLVGWPGWHAGRRRRLWQASVSVEGIC